MAKKRTKKLKVNSNLQTIRKVVPIKLITIKDKYKSIINKNVKSKYKVTDKVVFELIMKSIKEIPKEEIINSIPKKYLKKIN